MKTNNNLFHLTTQPNQSIFPLYNFTENPIYALNMFYHFGNGLQNIEKLQHNPHHPLTIFIIFTHAAIFYMIYNKARKRYYLIFVQLMKPSK